MALHRQAVDAHSALLFVLRVIDAALVVVVVAGLFQHAVGDEVLACAVAFHDGLNQVLWHVAVVGQKLLRVLRKAVASVAERRVVVVAADARVETDAVDDVLCRQTFHLSIGV